MMAVCDYCTFDMKNQVSCTLDVAVIDGVEYSRIRFQPMLYPMSMIEKCHDCWTPLGGQHHPGCDAEICPKCFYQAISCECRWDGEVMPS